MDTIEMESGTVMRVHFSMSILSVCGFALAFLQGCASFAPTPAAVPVATAASASTAAAREDRPDKIVRFADALGAVAASGEQLELRSMINAFDYCDREQRLAFVTKPFAYSARMNLVHVSTYSLRFNDETVTNPSEASAFVAPFECIDQKHSVKTGLVESEDVPSNALHHALADRLGGVIVHRVQPGSAFEENDIIVAVGGLRIQSRGELAKAVDVTPVGQVSFGVVRGHARIQIRGLVTDTTLSVRKNALTLLEALCKETGSRARSCRQI